MLQPFDSVAFIKSDVSVLLGGAALRAEDNKLRLVPNTSTFRVGSAILSLSVSITLLQYILLLLSTNSLQL